jgi:hypothetical protein
MESQEFTGLLEDREEAALVCYQHSHHEAWAPRYAAL